MAHPYKTSIKDKGIVRWRMIKLDEAPDDLTAFWEAVDTLPDEMDGKDYKKIIKKLFNQDGTPDFDSYEKLTQKLEKKGDKKNEEAFQEWHTAMGIIRKHVGQHMHMNMRKRERNERKQKIRERKEQSRLDRENRAKSARRIAEQAIELATNKRDI